MLSRLIKSMYSTSKQLYSQKVVSSATNPEHSSNLIIVHGFLGNGGLYRHLAEHSSVKKSYNSYLIDLPNYGKSYHTEEVSMYQMGEALGKWIKEEKLQNDITLLGHSLGGRTIYAMTKLFPELQEKVKRIIILDAAPHSYLEYPFHLSTQKLLKDMLEVNLGGTKEEIEQHLKVISPNVIWYETLLGSIDFPNKRWIFNLKELQKKYRNYIGFGIEEAEWKQKVIVLRATKSQFVNEKSIELLKRIYPKLEIVDVDCGHHIQLQKPLKVIDIITSK